MKLGNLVQIHPRRYPGAVSWVRKNDGESFGGLLFGTKLLFVPNHKHAIECGTGYLRIASQGLSRPFLKTFAAFFSDPSHRPWVSEDGPNANKSLVAIRFDILIF